MPRTWQAWQTVAVAATVLMPTCADAAWLGYKNDTQTVIVVQSASMVNNQVRLGKAHTLYPGEIAWDAVTAPGLRRLSVFDPKQPLRPLHQDVFNVQNVDIFLSVQVAPAAKGGQQPAQIRLVPIKAPVMPGITGPGTNPQPPGMNPQPPGGQKPSPVPPPPTPPKAGPPISGPPNTPKAPVPPPPNPPKPGGK
jgi:hypothetical protein